MAGFDLNSFHAMEAWRQQYSTLLWQHVHTDIMVTKSGVPHPLEAGFVVSIGEAAGQSADYRLPLQDGREVHVREYPFHYTVHMDQVSAVMDPIGHLISDAPHWIGRGLLFSLVVIFLWAAFGSSEKH